MFHDKPCAAAGLTSYRYRGAFGSIMIGARDHAHALNEARRSTGAAANLSSLEVWNGRRYVPVTSNHAEWSGSPDPRDPDNFWIDDETGERVNAATGERIPAQEDAR